MRNLFKMPQELFCSCVDSSGVDDQFVYGVESLTAQLRHARSGGLPPESSSISDSQYDEDDVYDVDPSSDPSLDRFERAEAIASRISDRMARREKEKLEHADA